MMKAAVLASPVLALTLWLGLGPAHAATAYTTDAAASRLGFTGVQAGAEFKGTFHQFTAAVDFAPEALASAHLDVVIDLNSVDTLDKDRDKTMRGADIFDVAHFPTAHYVTKSITKTATGVIAPNAQTASISSDAA